VDDPGQPQTRSHLHHADDLPTNDRYVPPKDIYSPCNVLTLTSDRNQRYQLLRSPDLQEFGHHRRQHGIVRHRYLRHRQDGHMLYLPILHGRLAWPTTLAIPVLRRSGFLYVLHRHLASCRPSSGGCGRGTGRIRCFGLYICVCNGEYIPQPTILATTKSGKTVLPIRLGTGNYSTTCCSQNEELTSDNRCAGSMSRKSQRTGFVAST
jgi:hypothetical protein